MEGLKKTIIMIVLALAISQSFFTSIYIFRFVNNYVAEEHIITTGKASGVVSFCINDPPTLNLSACSHNATQGIPYDCWLNATDPNYAAFIYGATFDEFYRPFSTSNSSLFNITPDGYIYFLPSNDDVGNYSITFSVNDRVECSNSETTSLFDLEVINVNDPPVLNSNIPDQNYLAGEVLHALFLNNYFSDPDLDPLNYSYVSSGSAITITILASSELLITADVCNLTELVVFFATDPYDETNQSNPVIIKCEEDDEDESGGTGSGYVGGGGGGGSSNICVPEYECFDITSCRKNNTKLQMCVDTKGCREERYLTVPCKYEELKSCNESWKCSGWGPCLPNGTQYRNCTDENSCGTFKLRPEISRSCEYIGTCDDGILNCHDGACEENIDCGGPCPVCKSIEVPYPFSDERGIGIYLLTGIVLLLLTAVLVYHYFRKEINEALAKAGWVVGRRKRKYVLLLKDEKKKLLEMLSELEKKLEQRELPEIFDALAELQRQYLVWVIKNIKTEKDKGLDIDFDKDRLEKAIERNKRRLGPVLRKIFSSMFSSYQEPLADKEMMTFTYARLFIEELKNIALQTSESGLEDSARESVEFKVPNNAPAAERMLISIINTYIALQFVEVEVAKRKYLSLIADYEKLSLNEQEAVFAHLGGLYNNISYINSWFRPK